MLSCIYGHVGSRVRQKTVEVKTDYELSISWLSAHILMDLMLARLTHSVICLVIMEYVELRVSANGSPNQLFLDSLHIFWWI